MSGKRWERTTEILDKVRSELDIVDECQEELGSLKRIGTSYTAPCPFCGGGSGNTGNFMISPKEGGRGLNIFRCFKCEASGDSIKLRMKLHREDFVTAGLNLAVKKGIITDSEFESLTSSKFTATKVSQIEKQYAKEDAEKLLQMNKRASAEILDFVYSTLIKVCGLSEKDRKYLQEVRLLSDREIDYIGFFSMPKGPSVLEKLREEFKGSPLVKGLEDPLDILKFVPGFWFKVNAYMTEEGRFRKKVDGKWETVTGDDRGKWEFSKHADSIGFPIRNADGKAVAIQIRLSDADAERMGGKYRFFTSAKYANEAATKEEKRIWGASPGAPADVTIPMNLKSWRMVVTEGKFKGYQLAKRTKMVSISVQGVASWRPIVQSIKDMRKSMDLRKKLMGIEDSKEVYIAFDNDMFYKSEVFDQAKKLANALRKEGFQVSYMSWDSAYKGADDYILAKGKESSFSIHKSEVLEKKHELISEIIRIEEKLGKWDRISQEQYETRMDLFNRNLIEIEDIRKKTKAIN